jgi:release factor glutamine methyltransferase
MPETAPWTVGRLLQWTADYLKAHGADTPRLDAEVLLAHALGCQRIELYTAFEEVPGEQPRAAFRELVRQRAEGTPVAYLVGRREFYSLSFRVTPAVLIPRPETELLVVALLDLAEARAAAGPLRIADVGTGSGIIAICAAKHLTNCQVTAIDISPAALDVARLNATEHGVADRVELLESDLFAAIPPDRSFDFVVSNPPYVSIAEMQTLAPDVRKFEPPGALVAGETGTEVIAALIPQAAERLSSGGHLLIEISPMIHDAVLALLGAETRFQPLPTIKDLARLPRVVQAVRK